MRFQIKHKITTLILSAVTFYAVTSGSTPVKTKMVLENRDSAETDTGNTIKKFRQTGLASYYANKFHGRRTASGEKYSKYKLTAAHRTLPFGTMVKVSDAKTGKWLVVRINDRGPFNYRRIIDLSYEAARQLGMIRGKGLLKVKIRVVEWPEPKK